MARAAARIRACLNGRLRVMLLVAESCSACLKFRVDEETGIGWLEILLIAVGGVCLLGVAGVVICFVADTRQTYEIPGGETMFDALPQLERPTPHPLG